MTSLTTTRTSNDWIATDAFFICYLSLKKHVSLMITLIANYNDLFRHS